MCGIAGYLSNNKGIDQSVLKNMCDELHHRGPDDHGTYYYNHNNSEVALGHRRLSIIDLSACGHQPMHFNEWHIVFNGEVYNYAEIRAELINEGYTFVSNSDTEVILKAFDKWDVDCVHRFIGMFSFVILNEKRGKLYCFRDRAGVKPFFYYKSENDFVWASELKAIHQYPSFKKEIDGDSLQLYLEYGYVASPHTIFKNCFKLDAGSYLEIDIASNTITQKKYWDVYDYYSQAKVNVNEGDVLEKLESLLVSSCNYRMVADVPVGVFLSGGIDSSIVAAILQKNRSEKIKTFTIGFNHAGFDEAPHARAIADYLGTEHHEFYCTEKEAQDVIKLLPSMYDEPCGDSSAIPTYLVSKMAKEKVTVALSADGGDETFFGYNSYPAMLGRYNQVKKMPVLFKLALRTSIPILAYIFKSNFQKSRKLEIYQLALKHKDFNAMDFSAWWNKRFHAKDMKQLLLKFNPKSRETFFTERNVKTAKIEEMDQLMALDYKAMLVDDLLTKVDRATMAVSLEGREPLLDHRLIEYAATLPAELKYKERTQKYLLKEIAYKYIPKKLLDRPKSGFSIPLKHWFRGDMKYLLDEYLSPDFLNKQGLFNSNYVQGLLDKYYKGQDDTFEQIWFILMFQMWFKKWMD